MHSFRNLLLISMGRMSSFEKDPTPATWTMLFNMARVQSLTGVLYDALPGLPEKQRPPQELAGRWRREAEKIAEVYTLHEGRIAELSAILARLGLHGCILKGTGLSRLYPRPERRMCGDIDVWIEGGRDRIIAAFEDAGYPVYGIIYQEAKAAVFDDTQVEIHFHASKMYNPFCNARLQRWLRAHSPISAAETLSYPSASFNAVFCMAHMYRHYLEGGIGMRQMMDYYHVLKQLSPSGRKEAFKTLKRLGMKKFTAAVMTSMWYNFALEDEYLLCGRDMKLGGRLINDVINMGNFGIMDGRNYAREGESAFSRFRRKNRRVFSNLHYYPREVLWSPFARLAQYVWRRCKAYA